MNPKLLPASPRDDAGWERTLHAFLAKKERRSGSRRTVESYARMLWPFFSRVGSPELVTPALVLRRSCGPRRRGPSSKDSGSAPKGIRTPDLHLERVAS